MPIRQHPLPSRLVVRFVATDTSTANPRAPPTCWAVVTMPEARPASASPASETAEIVKDTKLSPRPTDMRTMAGTMSLQYWA